MLAWDNSVMKYLIDLCPDCNGTGEIETEHEVPMSFSVSSGAVEVRVELCDYCNGTGEIDTLTAD